MAWVRCCGGAKAVTVVKGQVGRRGIGSSASTIQTTVPNKGKYVVDTFASSAGSGSNFTITVKLNGVTIKSQSMGTYDTQMFTTDVFDAEAGDVISVVTSNTSVNIMFYSDYVGAY